MCLPLCLCPSVCPIITLQWCSQTLLTKLTEVTCVFFGHSSVKKVYHKQQLCLLDYCSRCTFTTDLSVWHLERLSRLWRQLHCKIKYFAVKIMNKRTFDRRVCQFKHTCSVYVLQNVWPRGKPWFDNNLQDKIYVNWFQFCGSLLQEARVSSVWVNGALMFIDLG